MVGIFASFQRSLQLAKSHHGCDFGWIVKYEGRPVGELDDWRPEDMFWDSYHVVCTSEADQAIIFNPTHWEYGHFAFVNRVMDVRMERVLAGKAPEFVSNGRVLLRGLSAFPRSRAENWMVNILEPFYRLPLGKNLAVNRLLYQATSKQEVLEALALIRSK